MVEYTREELQKKNVPELVRIQYEKMVEILTYVKNKIEWQQSVLTRGVTDPSTLTPSDGDRYLIPSGAVGVWSTHVNDIAEWSDEISDWIYTTPTDYMAVTIDDEGVAVVWNGSAWVNFGDVISHAALQNLDWSVAGHVMDTDLDMNSHKITELLDPTANQDAATKYYVDNVSGVFTNLTDTPSSYAGKADAIVVVNNTPDGLIFEDRNTAFNKDFGVAAGNVTEGDKAALLAGRSGGQIIYGGLAIADKLLLRVNSTDNLPELELVGSAFPAPNSRAKLKLPSGTSFLIEVAASPKAMFGTTNTFWDVLDMNNNQINELADPTLDDDAANLKTVKEQGTQIDMQILNGVQQTTNATFTTVWTPASVSLPAGKYLIAFTFEISNTVANKEAYGRVLYDTVSPPTSVRGTHAMDNWNVGALEYSNMCSFEYIDHGSPFTLYFLYQLRVGTTGGTASMRNMRLWIMRVQEGGL